MFQYDNFARDILLPQILSPRTSKSFTDENGGFFPDTEAHGLLIFIYLQILRLLRPSSLKHGMLPTNVFVLIVCVSLPTYLS